MLDGLDFPAPLHARINELIALKSSVGEQYIHTQENGINEYIERIIAIAEMKADALPPAKGQIEDLNTFFRKQLID